MKGEKKVQKKTGQNGKIRLGRLAVDPIFLLLMLFSLLSALTLGLFILFSLR